jgi:mannan endo-1,4-beta-mannosidase
MGEYTTLQDAPDWGQERGICRWFICYYLGEMRQAEQAGGRRLLDALDVHWYPEAMGDHRIVDDAATTTKDGDARMQAPRSLWDPTYRETSWIDQYYHGIFLPLLPALKASIDQYYPGTKLAITEYDYGGGNDITGGLAQVDVLGAFGRYGVDITTLWGIQATDTYVSSAFKLYGDYDGKGGKYGATAVRATTSDVTRTSVYASSEADASGPLHIILVNKARGGPVDVRFTIRGGGSYTAAQAWGFDATGAGIRTMPAVNTISGNTFTYTLPPLSAVHLVLK